MLYFSHLNVEESPTTLEHCYTPGSEQTPFFQVPGIMCEFPHNMYSLLPLQLQTILNGKAYAKRFLPAFKEYKARNYSGGCLVKGGERKIEQNRRGWGEE